MGAGGVALVQSVRLGRKKTAKSDEMVSNRRAYVSDCVTTVCTAFLMCRFVQEHRRTQICGFCVWHSAARCEMF